MSNDTGTYGITGVPPPSDVKYLTKTIPYAPGMPLRQEISVLADPTTDEGRDQWTLFVLALEKFKAIPVEEKLSYFQVAGIHCYPLVSWDQGKPEPGKGGYCAHNTLGFSTWHRVYMILFEQLMWKNMNEIIEDWHLAAPDAARWKKAADTSRLPYWDWARKQKYTDNFALPSVLTASEVKIFPPQSVISQFQNADAYPNPLYGFDNPELNDEGDPRRLGDMPTEKQLWNIQNNDPNKKGPKPANKACLPWSLTTGTGRWGIQIKPGKVNRYTGLDGVNNFTAANLSLATIDKPNQWYEYNPGNLSDAVSRLLTKDNSTWGTFASTKWYEEGSDPAGFLSLEYIHNNVHNVTGGGDFSTGVGHMSDVPVAAFDPIFWLHHCQIDRLLSLWQALYWNLWWDKPEPENPDGKQNKPDLQPNDPLFPFHTKSDGDPVSDVWTSEACRDWTKLGYQYDSLVPTADALNADGSLNEEKYMEDLQAYIHRTYPGTAQVIKKIRTDNEIKVPKGLLEAQGKPFDDYVINVQYDRYALGGTSYAIKFFLGGPKNVAKTHYIEENYIGEVFTFTGPLPTSPSETGCANCKAQSDDNVLSQGQIPITIPLINHIFDTTGEHPIRDFAEVADYLRLHLNWKFVQHGGLVRDSAEFPKTKISVMRGSGKPRYKSVEETSRPAMASISALSAPEPIALPPVYYGYEPVYEATEGKDWGLGHEGV